MVADFCQRNKIRRLALFGSVLREDFTPESDVDVLVEFEPDARVGYFALGKMETELEDILGRKADIYTYGGSRTAPIGYSARRFSVLRRRYMTKRDDRVGPCGHACYAEEAIELLGDLSSAELEKDRCYN